MSKIVAIILLLMTSFLEAGSPTCLITVPLNDNGLAHGSGTAYYKSNDGIYVLTCKHLIRGARSVAIAQSCNQYQCFPALAYVPVTTTFDHGSYQAWVYAVHPTEDLALAFIPKRGLKVQFITSPIANFDPQVGQPCYSQGHPNGGPLVTSRGYLTSPTSLSYPAIEGMSGGGLFQGKRLIGVVVATDDRSALFVPVHVIRGFTSRSRVFQMVEGPLVLEAVRPLGPEIIETPKVQEPEIPKVQAPKVQAPKVQAPKVQAPKVQAPKVQAPKVQAPKVQAPETSKNLENKLDTQLAKIDKVEKIVTVSGGILNFFIPGAGLIMGAAGTGLGWFLKRRAVRKSGQSQDQEPKAHSWPPMVKPKVQGPSLVQSQEPQGPKAPEGQRTWVQDPRAPQGQPYPVVMTTPAPKQVIHTETYPTQVEVDKWSKRFAWAKAQMCQKQPGSIGTLEQLEGLMKQCKD